MLDFAGDIEESMYHCFLTNRSLYLLVWNVTQDPRSLKEWLNWLVAYVPNSFVMVVGTHADRSERDRNECIKI